MKSPLKLDQDLVKELDIPKECELHPRQKIAFLEAQLNEMKSIQWRSRVDVLHAARLSESKIEALRNKGLQRITEHKNEVKQFTGGILMLQQLIEELKKESPTED